MISLQAIQVDQRAELREEFRDEIDDLVRDALEDVADRMADEEISAVVTTDLEDGEISSQVQFLDKEGE